MSENGNAGQANIKDVNKNTVKKVEEVRCVKISDLCPLRNVAPDKFETEKEMISELENKDKIRRNFIQKPQEYFSCNDNRWNQATFPCEKYYEFYHKNQVSK